MQGQKRDVHGGNDGLGGTQWRCERGGASFEGRWEEGRETVSVVYELGGWGCGEVRGACFLVEVGIYCVYTSVFVLIAFCLFFFFPLRFRGVGVGVVDGLGCIVILAEFMTHSLGS